MISEVFQQVLSEVAEESQHNDVPAISEDTGYLLYGLARSFSAQSILEIGTAHGYSTLFLALAAQKNGGQVTSCEMSEPSYRVAQQHFLKAGLQDRIDLRFGNALDIVPALETNFDMVFVDGMKSDYHLFFQLVSKKIRSGAVIIFDNVSKFPDKTKKFWEMLEGQTEFQVLTLPAGQEDELLLMKKL